MLPETKHFANYYIKPAILYSEVLASPAHYPKRKKAKTQHTPEHKSTSPRTLELQEKMPDTAKDTLNNATGNAPGGRGLGEVGSALGSVAPTPGIPRSKNTEGNSTAKTDEGFGLNGEDVKGSLKVHIKLDLEADIRIIARIKGDIAIGML
ncbi:hypothetical protein EJ02DRAFT_458535 [Clathrospora elynae]|uniref:Uncharacterized protein n=1 Tax=Clathrospora elynae TaxID=706981 RepID=A0A6A5SDI7_9PLEO|nr:hypothetical protein EJ02DRAFT_458535 [Clathrospora elynae]